MADPDFGWTVEMQIKAARHRLRVKEVPVDYRPRIGHSKISGTLNGSVRAGYKILYTIFRYGFVTTAHEHRPLTRKLADQGGPRARSTAR
jgi:hypothetical protein